MGYTLFFNGKIKSAQLYFKNEAQMQFYKLNYHLTFRLEIQMVSFG